MLGWLKNKFSQTLTTAEAVSTNRQNSPAPSPAAIPPEHDALKSQGNALLQQGQLPAAVQAYRKALACHPGSVEARINLGFVLREMSQHTEAESCLAEALMLEPSNLDACYIMATVKQAQGSLDEAISRFRKCLDIEPGFEPAFNDLFLLLVEHVRLEDARSLVVAGLEKSPDNAGLHCCMGDLYFHDKLWDKARGSYSRALEAEPDHAGALDKLGRLYELQKRHEDSASCFAKLASLDPGNIDAHNNLGRMLAELGKHNESIAAYKIALQIQPGTPEIMVNLGLAYKAIGDVKTSAECYRQALQVIPGLATAHSYLGDLLQEQDQTDDAILHYRHALVYRPDFYAALNNLGNALSKSGKLDEALAIYRNALEVNPDSAETLCNMGTIFRENGLFDEAAEHYRRTLQVDPAYASAHNNLGNIFKDRGQLEDAAKCYQSALVINPAFAEALNNLGNVYKDQGKLREAYEQYFKALSISPDFYLARLHLTHAALHLCEWEGLDSNIQTLRNALASSGQASLALPPFVFLGLPSVSAAEQRNCASLWTRNVYGALERKQSNSPFRHLPNNDGKIHIGYLSADFHTHATALLMAKTFELHNRELFHVTAYSYGPDDHSPMRERLTKAFDQFVDIRNLSNFEAADRISRDRIDILVDLKGYTQNTRSAILALRPARIQVNYLGYPGTMGADFVDYLIADRFIIPAEHQVHYTEEVIYLDGCYQPNDCTRSRPDAPARRECGLPEDAIVFCSFNQTYKITPKIFDIWCRLLRDVPGSVLWLLASSPEAEGNLKREAQKRDITPDRLVIAPTMSPEKHRARLQCADLFLDTLPYNAHTTCSDALWMGLPVITCPGDTFASRVAGSLLNALYLPELVTEDLDAYYTLALDLARNNEKRAALRTRIKSNCDSAPLFNSERFTLSLEKTYQTMFEGLSPIFKRA